MAAKKDEMEKGDDVIAQEVENDEATVQIHAEVAVEPDASEQPEGVMAAGEEFDDNSPCHEIPWDNVIKWSIVVSVVSIVLYLILRRKD
jgi:hypothetical protein